MKIAKFLIVISLLMILPVTYVQAQRNFTEEADNAFKYEKYFAAIPLYRKAYGKVSNKIEKKRIIFQIGECYRLTKDPKKAEAQYIRAVKAKYADPILYLHLADVQREQGKYREAIENYKEYIKKMPSDPRGQLGMKSCENILEWEKIPSRYLVENVKKINSRNDDFSPVYADKKFTSLVFTSTRKESDNKIDPNTGQPFSSLFVVQMDNRDNWSEPILIDEDQMINSGKGNNGSANFNNKYNTLYFTRCISEKKSVLGCQIYESSKKGKLWDQPVALPIAADSIAVGHPAIYGNEKDIIFASDLPGGYGGKDLWIAKRRKKSVPFSKPINLGKTINTRGNEMFPTLREMDNGTIYLYFSSDGLGGAGGLDIFRSEFIEGEWSEPVNLGIPLNSAGDDFGIIFSESRTLIKTNTQTRQKTNCEEMGFLTSDRAGGKGKTDIWEFWMPEIVFTLAGTIRDNQTLQLLKSAKVILVGSDGSNLQTTTDQRGYYFFNKNQINRNITYTLEVSQKGYFTNRNGKTTTVGLLKSQDLIVNINLEPIPKDPIPLPEIRFDLAKWDLKPQYQDSLNGLIATMTANPTIVIELAAHTDVRDEAIKNDELSFKRARSCVEYLVTKGIEIDRMTPVGYGENKPRVLAKGYTYTSGEYKGVSFPAGTVLTETYIESLRTTKEKEAAHQLNRRVEFRILRDDYVPKNSNDTMPDQIKIAVNPDEKKLPFVIKDDLILVDVILNGNTYEGVFDEKTDELKLSLDVVMGLIGQHKLTKKDFNDLDSAFTEDGTVKDGMKFNVNSLMVGTKRIYDIEAVCIHGQKNPIIFGDAIMSDMYDYKVDKDKKQFIFE
jgi:peptidoglycan-associated lipoprotein